MMGGPKAHYDGIKAFSETDFTEDLQDLKVPVLICTATTIKSCRPLPHAWRVVGECPVPRVSMTGNHEDLPCSRFGLSNRHASLGGTITLYWPGEEIASNRSVPSVTRHVDAHAIV